MLAASAIAAADGGYFPASWGWVSLLALFAATLAALTRRRSAWGRLDLALLAGLGLYCSWQLASASWAPSTSAAVNEAQRSLAYLSIAFLALLVVDRSTTAYLLGGMLVGVSAIGGYSLFLRLLPDRLGSPDGDAPYRLSEPIGYWNGLGIYAALGVLLAVGLAARASDPGRRAASAFLAVPLACVVLFTFSRGAWLALVLGLMAAVALDSRRLQLVAAWLVVAPWLVAAVVLGAHSEPLTTRGATLSAMSAAGHRQLIAIVFLSLGAGLSTLMFAHAGRRVRVGFLPRAIFGGALVVVLIAGATAGIVRLGSPLTAAGEIRDRFTARPQASGDDLPGRLLDLSANGRIGLWRVSVDGFRDQPVTGRGAGSFALEWRRLRPDSGVASEGHSLYLETLGEVGLVGFGLLALIIGSPIVAAIRARHDGLVPVAFSVFVAWSLHAGVDWDWELVGVSAIALLAAVAIVVSARPGNPAIRGTGAIRVACATGVLGAIAFVGLMGSVPVDNAERSLERGELRSAIENADRAAVWQPWSSEPLAIRGAAELALGRRAAAHRAFLAAVERDPRRAERWIDLATTSRGRQRIAALEAALLLDPRNKQAREMLATWEPDPIGGNG